MDLTRLLGPRYSTHDVPLHESENYKKKADGIEAVFGLFKLNEFGVISPEITLISQVACVSAFTGCIYGGFMNTRTTYTDFVKNNQSTIYRDHMEAKKKLQDKFTKMYGAGAFKWGWRLCYFTTTYVTISTCVATYRGKNGILDHSIAGLLTGFSYKLLMGPRAWVVGAGLGCALGTIAGSMTVLLLKAAGLTMADVKQLHYRIHESREGTERDAMKTYIRQEQIGILTEHDDRIGDAGKTLDALQHAK